MANGVGVAVPESEPRGRVDVLESGVGSMTLVRFGSGEEGSEGGSWSGAGVEAVGSADIAGLFGEVGTLVWELNA